MVSVQAIPEGWQALRSCSHHCHPMAVGNWQVQVSKRHKLEQVCCMNRLELLYWCKLVEAGSKWMDCRVV